MTRGNEVASDRFVGPIQIVIQRSKGHPDSLSSSTKCVKKKKRVAYA